jgi:cytochrome c553
MTRLLLALALAASFAAGAADDRFMKKTPDSMMGFLAVRDPVYLKECGTCHFAYSPGLLPARSWVLHLDRMATGKHFGESVQLPPATRAQIQEYLTRNAADVSPYEGSKTFMEGVKASQTPYRLTGVRLFKEMHTVIHEVIATKNKVKVRSITNCNACHRKADEGSFGNDELYIPGLTGP